MKKLLLLVGVLVQVSVWGQENEGRNFEDLIGSWRNKNGAGLDIVDSNTVYIVRCDQRKRATAHLSDVSKNPITFDLTIRDTSRQVTLKGRLMLVGNNMLQWQVFDTETKPASYNSSRGDMFLLKRIDRLMN